jgi:dTDP-4-dehydrorhamnose reductase
MQVSGLGSLRPLATDMRVAVTGKTGQIATALIEAATGVTDLSVHLIGRPEIDLRKPDNLLPMMEALRPDLVINAAAWTAVDLAETEADEAMAINSEGAASVARAASDLGIPIIQVSTDYVFDGTKSGAYLETDTPGPTGVYGLSKLAGEQVVASISRNHAILRISWVYAAEGKNFVRAMLRLAETRDEVSVVADQTGCPGYAPDISRILIAMGRQLVSSPGEDTLRGVFHLGGSEALTWADFAEAIFAGSAKRNGPFARVKRIATKDYPTPAQRPQNSYLDGTRLAASYCLRMPPWQNSLEDCLDLIFRSRS